MLTGITEVAFDYKICTACGSRLSPGAKFCSQCGAEVSPET